MFEATLSEDFWGEEDFTCNECHVIFTSRRAASVHAETKHKVRRLLIKDRARVEVDVGHGDACEVIRDIDVNGNSEGEYFELMKEETVEEIKKEDIFNVNTNGRVGSQSENEMDISVGNLKQEEGGVKVEVKDIKVEENKTGGPSVKVESWEYFEEDDAESKYPAKKKKIVLMKAKPEILDEGGAESVEADTDMDTRKDTEGAAGEGTQEDTEAKPDIGDEERESASSVGDDSDSDIMTPERYDRQAEEDAKYQDQLGIIIEDDDEEEKKEVSFVICSPFSLLFLLIPFPSLSGGANS